MLLEVKLGSKSFLKNDCQSLTIPVTIRLTDFKSIDRLEIGALTVWMTRFARIGEFLGFLHQSMKQYSGGTRRFSKCGKRPKDRVLSRMQSTNWIWVKIVRMLTRISRELTWKRKLRLWKAAKIWMMTPRKSLRQKLAQCCPLCNPETILCEVWRE